MLLPRAERSAAILRAAAGAFAEQGFAGTSMEDVAAEAGVTKLIVYRHFDSKEELYRAVLQRVSNRLIEEFLRGIGQGPPRGVGVRTLLVVAREDPDGFRLLWRHASREPQFAGEVKEFQGHAIGAAHTLLTSLIEDPVMVVWAARTVIAYLVEAVLNWLDHGDPARDDEMAEHATAGLQGLVNGWTGR